MLKSFNKALHSFSKQINLVCESVDDRRRERLLRKSAKSADASQRQTTPARLLHVTQTLSQHSPFMISFPVDDHSLLRFYFCDLAFVILICIFPRLAEIDYISLFIERDTDKISSGIPSGIAKVIQLCADF